ncbi:serine hydrolase domain-containing protein [Ascidiaceihabitans sp.]|uniref:serine hydrolase domain-containing protein n=1 Tax=Ascidiaceihabitans sp. TaxID=1872644 RepID=UPI003296E5C9
MFNLDVNRLDPVKAWMQSYVDDGKFAGCATLVFENGHERFFHTAGYADLASGRPFERDTIARIYSMTKPVTTVALMILVERGLVHLDAPVSRFLPEFKDCRALRPGAQDIDDTVPCPSPTLHQLLTHTSGLSYPFNPGVLAAEMAEDDLVFKPDQGALADMCKAVAKLPLSFVPGTRWEYSVGIDVIGRVIEVIRGQDLALTIQQMILDPLGMEDTGFSVRTGHQDRFASLYTPLTGDPLALNAAQQGSDAPSLRCVDTNKGSPFLAASMASGGGGLVGTIDDYARFSEMLRLGGIFGDVRLLSTATVAFMMRNHLPDDIASMGPQSFAEQPMEGMGFGLGGAVVLDPARARSAGSVGDFSWGGMASTFFWIDPVQDLSVIFFTQLSPSSSYPARPELKALVHGALI